MVAYCADNLRLDRLMESIPAPHDCASFDRAPPPSGVDGSQRVWAELPETGAFDENFRYSILTFGWGAPADSIAGVLPHYAVEFASSGRDALVRLNARAFDAYILDYFVPDWGGVPLCREIRKRDAHVPIIFYSSYQDPKATRRMVHAGANIHLSKPGDTGLVAGAVDAILESARSRNALARQAARLAVVMELDRLTALARKLAGPASSLRSRSGLRTTRIAACKAFLAAGGTCAAFERWWISFEPRLPGAPLIPSPAEACMDC